MNRSFFDEDLPTLLRLRTKNNDEAWPIILKSEGIFLMSCSKKNEVTEGNELRKVQEKLARSDDKRTNGVTMTYA